MAQPLQLVFPSGISPKYANEPDGQARMRTCLDQYIANKPNNANGGLAWISKAVGIIPNVTSTSSCRKSQPRCRWALG